MSWLFSQVLVEEYLGDTSSDGEQSAPLNGNPTQQAYCAPDKMTDFSRLSRFGMTYKPLTESRGEDLLTLYLEDFRAKTSQQQEREMAWKESDQECGDTWRGWLAKYDHDTSLWKTPQCSLLGEEQESLEILPKWGMTVNGLLWELQTLEPTTSGTECGLWASPNARDWKDSGASQGNRKSPNLGTQVHWPTPVTDDISHRKHKYAQGGTALSTKVGGKLNPTWVEWLMGWPLGWTDLRPLETDKSHSVPQKPGDC
jgi:hypothetical protein